MKTLTTLIVTLFAITMTSTAKEEPLVPSKINILLGKIKPEMKESKILAVIRESYPEATAQAGVWSGSTGYIDFKLNKRYTISCSAISIGNHNNRKTHKNLNIYVFDWTLKRRVDISFHTWNNVKNVDNNVATDPMKPIKMPNKSQQSNR